MPRALFFLILEPAGFCWAYGCPAKDNISQLSLLLGVAMFLVVAKGLKVKILMKLLDLFLKSAGGGGLVTKSCPTLATPWAVAHRAPLSMGFSRQEYWSGFAISLSRGSSRPRD